MFLRLFWLAAGAVLIGRVLASAGDRDMAFRSCVSDCTGLCDPSELPATLRLTRWTCSDDCKYVCMQDITTQKMANGKPVLQYYGKWPFWRLFGIQEPASVAFSLLNMWLHLKGNLKLRNDIPGHHPMKRYYLVWSFASINTWIWSTVFHTRDTPLTEKLDYFSAALTILFALYVAVIRLFHLYPFRRKDKLVLSSARQSHSDVSRRAWTLVCSLTFLGHVSYLSLLPRFDYTYNIIFNLVVGMTHNVLWLIYALPARLSLIHRFPSQPKFYRPMFVGQIATLVLLTTCATGLELFDFPPVARAIDAHSLWHLATAPITLYWYRFLVTDSLDASWREHKI